MSLVVTIPPSFAAERNYVLRIVLSEFLGLSFEVRVGEDAAGTTVVQSLNTDCALFLNDVLFGVHFDTWLKKTSLPKLPLERWTASDDIDGAKTWGSDLPILYAERLTGGSYVSRQKDQVRVGIDLLGGIFYMLTRYEEVVLLDQDRHGRFPLNASLAAKENFLERPLVDEYLEVLWLLLKEIDPSLTRPAPQYKVRLSHDVDWPFTLIGLPWKKALRQAAGQAVRRMNIPGAVTLIRCRWHNRPEFDPANCFDWLMQLSENAGIQSEFYFIAGHSGPGEIDGAYHLKNSAIQQLIKKISARGHLIGIHPSYETWKDGERIKLEFDSLQEICRTLGIQQSAWGGRQHYLRWTAPETWQYWDDAKLDYDSSVGFAQHIGFRCGTGREFPVFNLLTRQSLRLRERPLLIMDQSLLNPQYMGLAPIDALKRAEQIVNACKFYGTDCSILWHNTMLLKPDHRDLYEGILKHAASF